MEMHNPPHAGEILREYIAGTGKSITEIAKGLGISRKHLSLILNAHAGISAEMAIKLAVAFGTSADFWMNFQKNYDLWHAKQKVDVSVITPFLNSAA